MASKKKKVEEPADASLSAPDEQWAIVQVAAFLSLPYQTARNNMLAGDYGPPEYNAQSRKLTVSSLKVRAVKSKGRPKKPIKKRHR